MQDYRNGIRIAVSTCSTVKPGHETLTGVSVVLHKDKQHRSSTYGGAPMPNMNRLTWDGIALRAGELPGNPASHGCVRLPLAFSERLFSITHVGTPVIIAGGHTDPTKIVHPGLVLSDYAKHDQVRKNSTKQQRKAGFETVFFCVLQRTIGEEVEEDDIMINNPASPWFGLMLSFSVLAGCAGGSSGGAPQRVRRRDPYR